MKISKKSWHYKLYCLFGDSPYSKRTSLCAYFWRVVWNAILTLISLACFSWFVYMAHKHQSILLGILLWVGSALLHVGLFLGVLISILLIFIVFVSFVGSIVEEDEPRPGTPGAKVRLLFRPFFLKVSSRTDRATSSFLSFKDVIFGFLKASKERLCPLIDFVD